MYMRAVHFHYSIIWLEAFKANIYLGTTIEIMLKLEQAFISIFQVSKNFKGTAALIETFKLTFVQDWFVSLWSIQEKPENNERIRNNGNFIAVKNTYAGGGRETRNLFGVA